MEAGYIWKGEWIISLHLFFFKPQSDKIIET